MSSSQTIGGQSVEVEILGSAETPADEQAPGLSPDEAEIVSALDALIREHELSALSPTDSRLARVAVDRGDAPMRRFRLEYEPEGGGLPVVFTGGVGDSNNTMVTADGNFATVSRPNMAGG